MTINLSGIKARGTRTGLGMFWYGMCFVAFGRLAAACGGQAGRHRRGAMDITRYEPSTDLFGGDVPEKVRGLVESARAAGRDDAAPLLQAALCLAPDSLPLYYLLYKLHAGCGELKRAEEVALRALSQAGRQAGLPTSLEAAATWQEDSLARDMFLEGPARFWLFTLKALSFISARRGKMSEARAYLELLTRCDPTHSVGSEVTMQLVAAAD